MNDEELKLSEEAFRWIKTNYKKVIQKFADTAEYVADELPTTLFMAGSPGAGKTEISKRLVPRFKQKPIRIDADEIRTLCPGYTGNNAHSVSRCCNKRVHILYDYALKNNINVILDGTFAYNGALENIKRSLDRSRKVEIFLSIKTLCKRGILPKTRSARTKKSFKRSIH